MGRSERRQVSREIKNIAKKAKEAMYDWISQLQHEPTDKELQAWQAGYIAGLNANKD